MIAGTECNYKVVHLRAVLPRLWDTAIDVFLLLASPVGRNGSVDFTLGE